MLLVRKLLGGSIVATPLRSPSQPEPANLRLPICRFSHASALTVRLAIRLQHRCHFGISPTLLVVAGLSGVSIITAWD